MHLNWLPVGGVFDLESVEGEVPESAGGGNDPLRAGPDQGDLFLADVSSAYEDGEHRVARDWLDLPARLTQERGRCGRGQSQRSGTMAKERHPLRISAATHDFTRTVPGAP